MKISVSEANRIIKQAKELRMYVARDSGRDVIGDIRLRPLTSLEVIGLTGKADLAPYPTWDYALQLARVSLFSCELTMSSSNRRDVIRNRELSLARASRSASQDAPVVHTAVDPIHYPSIWSSTEPTRHAPSHSVSHDHGSSWGGVGGSDFGGGGDSGGSSGGCE